MRDCSQSASTVQRLCLWHKARQANVPKASVHVRAEQAGEWKIFLDVSSIKNTSQGAPGHQSPLVDHGG